MTKDDLMQQALTALESATSFTSKKARDQNPALIAALRAALAAQPAPPYSDIRSDGGMDPRNAFDKPAAPALVGHVYRYHNGDSHSIWRFDPTDAAWKIKGGAEAEAREVVAYFPVCVAPTPP